MRYPENAQEQIGSEFVAVKLSDALSGESKANLVLRDGDILTIKPITGWSDIAASVTLRGELAHPGNVRDQAGRALEHSAGAGGRVYSGGVSVWSGADAARGTRGGDQIAG